MKQPEPLELLKLKLKEYKGDLAKSIDLYGKGKIDVETHLEHKENLRPLIYAYENAILILETNKNNTLKCKEIHKTLIKTNR